MFCKYCKAEIDEDSIYCKKCGGNVVSVIQYSIHKGEIKLATTRAWQILEPFYYSQEDISRAEDLSDLNEVISLYDNIIKLFDSDAYYFLYRGIAKFLIGNQGDSIVDIDKALLMRPFYEKAIKWKRIISAKTENDNDLYHLLRYDKLLAKTDFVLNEKLYDNQIRKTFPKIQSRMNDEFDAEKRHSKDDFSKADDDFVPF